MKGTNVKAAQALADPAQYPNLFGNFEEGLKSEQFYRNERQNLIPANRFTSLPVRKHESILIEVV